MPRVMIKKRDYKLKDLKSWICGQMHTHGLKQKDVARRLGISQQAFSTRIKVTPGGKGRESDPFSYGDLLTLFELFGTTDEEKLHLLRN